MGFKLKNNKLSFEDCSCSECFIRDISYTNTNDYFSNVNQLTGCANYFLYYVLKNYGIKKFQKLYDKFFDIYNYASKSVGLGCNNLDSYRSKQIIKELYKTKGLEIE